MRTSVPAPAANEPSGRPASVSVVESVGSSSAVAASSSNMIASNRRSTAREANDVEKGTGVAFVSAYALAISPARAGTTLFTIIPTAVARHSGRSESLPATGSRIVIHLRARRAKIAVAQNVAAVQSKGAASDSL